MTSARFYVGENGEHNKITLNDATIEELFDEAFEGKCPICRDNQINDGELICRDCLAKAMTYHDWASGDLVVGGGKAL